MRMKKMGRPTKLTPALQNEILERLAEGESLLVICRDDDAMPARSTVSRWCRELPDFQDKVARAREDGTWVKVDETREIADDARNDYMEKFDKDGSSIGYFINGEAVARSKLRIEQRFREAEAHNPKVYGKRVGLDHSGSIGSGDRTSDQIMQSILDILATGRVKLPGGVVILEVEPDDDTAYILVDPDDPYDVG